MVAEQAAHRRWLNGEGTRLLDFAEHSAVDGGFGWLDDSGNVDDERGVELWITARMTHCFALAHLRGRHGAFDLLNHGMEALVGPLRDHEHGGWFARIGGSEGSDHSKAFYAHAFAILAASSATAAGHPDGQSLLDHALHVVDEHFWDEEASLGRESFNAAWDGGEDYRGANANMHAVEAYLAAADVTGRPDLLERAVNIAQRVVDGFAREHGWMLPEHYTATWEQVLDYNAGDPAHPFRPYGVTIGHLFEWSRLVLSVDAAAKRMGLDGTDWALPAAKALYRTGVRAGWAADGAPGFVYTVDFEGQPVVAERMHWVVAEAIGAAVALWQRTGEYTYSNDYVAWWNYVRTTLIDLDGGSWWHEVDSEGAPSRTVWHGKPDIYHAYQATLFVQLPLSPSFATALRQASA